MDAGQLPVLSAVLKLLAKVAAVLLFTKVPAEPLQVGAEPLPPAVLTQVKLVPSPLPVKVRAPGAVSVSFTASAPSAAAVKPAPEEQPWSRERRFDASVAKVALPTKLPE
jgi:hypothetical protein